MGKMGKDRGRDGEMEARNRGIRGEMEDDGRRRKIQG